MPENSRGWACPPGKARPASEVEIRLGRDLLIRESSTWPPYLAVTTPSAYRTAQPYLGREPAAVAHAGLLDWAALRELSDSLPDDAGLVVALGGGRALDAAKYVSIAKDLPLILVPTILSTGSIIHSGFAKWEGRQIIRTVTEPPWADCEHVLVDFGVVLQAPRNLNTAGIGDVLCGHAGLAEWRCSSALGIRPAYDEALARPTLDFFDEIVAGFPKTLDERGDLTEDSVRFIMKTVRERDGRVLRHAAMPPSDHEFDFATEQANDRGLVHGEACALGAVLVLWHTDEHPEALIEALDRCKVRFRPRDMNLKKEEMRRGLEGLPRWLSAEVQGRDVDSVMNREPIVGDLFEECWAWLSSI